MMRGRAWPLGLALMLGLPAALAAPSAAGNRAPVLDVQAGDYLQGQWIPAQVPATLSLHDDQGHLIRRWQAAEPGAQTLRVQATAAGRWQAEVAASDQLQFAPAVGLGQQMPLPAGPDPVTPPRSPRLQQLARQLQQLARQLQQGASTDAFWEQVAAAGGTLREPIGQQWLLTFLWRGARHSAAVWAGPDGDLSPMQRLDGSDVWYASFPVPADTFMSYQLVPDQPRPAGDRRSQRQALLAVAQADPHNRQRWGGQDADRFAQRSIVHLPAAPSMPVPARRTGLWQQRWVSDPLSGQTRQLSLYRSAGGQGEPVELVLFDAHAFDALVDAPGVIQALVDAGRLPPLQVVLVGNASTGSRSTELACDERTAQALVEHWLPALDDLRWPLPATRRVIAGASLGGLAATCAALAQPQQFGHVLALSPSYWWAPPGEAANALSRRVPAAGQAPTLRVFAGAFEQGRAGQPGIAPASQTVVQAWQQAGLPARLQLYSGGHDWYAWRWALAEGLQQLFPADAAGAIQ